MPDRPSDSGDPLRDAAQGDEALLGIAGRILDGERIEWEDRSISAGLESPATIDQLHLLDSVVQFHRSVQREGEASGDPTELRSWGHLEIIERIGSGSFGIVYQAWDPRLDREVALKILRPSVRSVADREAAPIPTADSPQSSPRDSARTIREARLLAKVSHPNIVTVYGADDHDGWIGIWMELIEGETLRALVRRQGPLGASEATAIGHDLLGALAAVHGAGILHRDIKAQNAMRAKGGRIVLTDFGLGEDLRAPRDPSGTSVMGTALYAAPERLRGGKATIRSDIYSLGVLLYYLTTAAYPFEGEDFPKLLEAHRRGARIYLRDRRPDLPRPFVDAVERALRTDPNDRYGSAGEMDLALTAAGQGTQVIAARARSTIRAIRFPRPRWRRVAWFLPIPLLVSLTIWLSSLGRYSIEAAMYRGLSHGGQASLTERDAITVDDEVFLELRATRDLYLYVMRRDSGGEMTLLFPGRRLEKPAPLARDVRHKLLHLTVGIANWPDSQTGDRGDRVQFLFVAVPRRIPGLEVEPTSANAPTVVPIADEDLVRALEPFLSPPGSRTPPGKRTVDEIFQQARPLGPARETVHGVWLRGLDLARVPQAPTR